MLIVNNISGDSRLSIGSATLLALLLLIFSLGACKKNGTGGAQPDVTFVKVYQNIPTGSSVGIYGAFCDPEGNLYTFFHQSATNYYYLIKTDNRGNFVQKKTLTNVNYIKMLSNNVGYSVYANITDSLRDTYFCEIDTGGNMMLKAPYTAIVSNFGYVTLNHLNKDNANVISYYDYALAGEFPCVGCISNSGVVLFNDTLYADTSVQLQSCAETVDGGYIFSGVSSNDVATFFCKTDRQGRQIWSKFLPQLSRQQDMLQISDTKYLLTDDSLNLTIIDSGANIIREIRLTTPYTGLLPATVVSSLLKPNGNILLNVSIAPGIYGTNGLSGTTNENNLFYEITPELVVKNVTSFGKFGNQLSIPLIVQGVNSYYFPGSISNYSYNYYLFIAKTNAELQY